MGRRQKVGDVEAGEAIASKKRVLDDSSEDDETDIKLTVNEDYKKRFEYNKQREELSRLEEKRKRGELELSEDDESESSTSEEEDEAADLLTDDMDQRIQQVVTALRKNDTAVLKDSSVRFFDDISTETKESNQKPVYLRDYHRMNLLGQLDESAVSNGDHKNDELPYAVKLERDREQLVKEMHAAGGGGSDSEEESDSGEFAPKKVVKQREVQPIELPDPAEDPEQFLDLFMNSKAWRPDARVGRRSKSGRSAPQLDNIVEDDSDFDDKTDEFEQKYNFRFEAGDEAGEIQTYGREVVNDMSVRRDSETARQRARRLRKETKEADRKQREQDRSRYRQLKVNQLVEKLNQVKQVAGISQDQKLSIDPADILDTDYEGDQGWDDKMEKLFSSAFYNDKIDTKKPVWDDDIQIDDIVSDHETEPDQEKVQLSGRQLKRLEKQSKQSAKKAEKDMRSKVEQFVDTEIMPTADIPSSTSKSRNKGTTILEPDDTNFKFRYREVSPEAFHLDPVDILLADDVQLNEYVGLKKFAPYRDLEKKAKDHKRYAKKKRLREWRKSVFGSASAPSWEAALEAANADASSKVLKPKKTKYKHNSKRHKAE
ncbi:KRI1-like family C-terminal-domain-containing protein [Lipomyces oligophaga]|uniref:KRI1-like family C-terminal-domain-containing protein n=1 Tax=Lipomyces oligophaga TaxID=45792 RepID=UPI0034CDBD10